MNAKRGRLETLSSQVKEETKNLNLRYKNYTKSLQAISLGEDDFVEALRDIKDQTYHSRPSGICRAGSGLVEHIHAQRRSDRTYQNQLRRLGWHCLFMGYL